MKFSRRGFLGKLLKGSVGAAGAAALAPELVKAIEHAAEKESLLPEVEFTKTSYSGPAEVYKSTYTLESGKSFYAPTYASESDFGGGEAIWDYDPEYLTGHPKLREKNLRVEDLPCELTPDAPQWDSMYAYFDSFGWNQRREQNRRLFLSLSEAAYRWGLRS